MKIAVINRKGGVSKSTLSRYMALELKRTGEKVTLVDTDINHKHFSDDENIFYNPTYEEIDTILESNETAIFDTGGLLSSVSDTLAQMCDLVVIPTGIYKIEVDEIEPMLKRLDLLGVKKENIVLVPTRIHHSIQVKSIKRRLDFGLPVTSPMRLRVAYSNNKPHPKSETEMYQIVKTIKNQYLNNKAKV